MTDSPSSIHELHRGGTWREDRQIDTITLDFDQRHRRRLVLHTGTGRTVLLDLPHAHRLRDGDGLVLPDGVIRVIAADEPVMDVHAPPAMLMRIAWHLGNRHLPVQLDGPALRLRADHVIADMITKLGGQVHHHQAPFDPEGGAYEPAPHAHDDPGA